MIRLQNMDCMEAMRGMPDKAYELAIVDPEYGDNGIFNGSADYANKYKQFSNVAPPQAYFDELFRVSKNQIIWGGNYFHLGPCRCFITWDKIRAVKNYSQVEFAWTSFDSPALLFRFCGNGGFILSAIDTKIHPTQKPVRLYEWLLKNYAKPGDKILDTHCGSGSILIACDIMGYKIDAYEIDKDYYEAAKARLERHQMQLTRIITRRPRQDLNAIRCKGNLNLKRPPHDPARPQRVNPDHPGGPDLPGAVLLDIL